MVAGESSSAISTTGLDTYDTLSIIGNHGRELTYGSPQLSYGVLLHEVVLGHSVKFLVTEHPTSPGPSFDSPTVATTISNADARISAIVEQLSVRRHRPLC